MTSVANELIKQYTGQEPARGDSHEQGAQPPQGGAGTQEPGTEDKGEGGEAQPPQGDAVIQEPGTEDKGEGGDAQPPQGDAVIQEPGVEDKGEQKPKADADVDDTKMLEYINKRFKKDFSTVEEAEEYMTTVNMTDEEKDAARKQQRENAVRYGINNDLFSVDDVAAYSKDKDQSPRDWYYSQFSEELRKIDANISTEEIAERFAEYMGDDLEDENPIKKLRENEVKAAQDAYLSNKYGALMNIDDTYQSHLSGVKAANRYRSLVEEVSKELSEFKVTVEDDELGKDEQEFKFNFSDKDINSVREMYLSPEQFDSMHRSGFDKDVVTEAMRGVLVLQKLPKLIKEISRAYASKKLLLADKGRQGALPERGSQVVDQQPNFGENPNPDATSVIEHFSGK